MKLPSPSVTNLLHGTASMDEHTLSQPFRWRRTFHWLHLFRAFRIALDVRKLLLLAAALFLVDSGNYFITVLFPNDGQPAVAANSIPDRFRSDFLHWNSSSAGATNSLRQPITPLTIARTMPDRPAAVIWQSASNWWLVLRPFREFIEPAKYLLGDSHSTMGVLQAVFTLIWILLVWAIFAGAVTRMAAVEFATEDRVGMFVALGFGFRRIPAYATAIMLPVLVFAALWGGGFLIGLASHIPAVGEVMVAILYPIGLLLAVVMGLIVMGMVIGWPLMVAAIGTEDTDGFDAFSRAFSHVYNRPWHYLWNALVMIIHGSIVIFYVGLFGLLVLYLTEHCIGAGMGEAIVHAQLDASWIVVSSDASPLAIKITTLWIDIWAALIVAFVFSQFWCASTINFFLLRLSDDGIPLGTVALDEPDDPGYSTVPGA